jgi:hypothetical protein
MIVGGLLVLLVGAVMGAVQGPGTVRAKEFVIVDDRGRDRGVLGFRGWTWPSVRLLDEKGQHHAYIGITETGNPVLVLSQAGGDGQVTLGISNPADARPNQPYAALSVAGTEMVSISCAGKDGPVVSVRNKELARMKICFRDGKPTLQASTPDGVSVEWPGD